MLNNLFEDMYSLLLEQKEIQQDLLDLSYEKRKATLASDTDKLNVIVQQELKKLSELNILEKKRTIALDKLSQALNVPQKDITVSLLIEKTEGELKEHFYILQKELTGLLNTQAELNAVNKELLETQLEYNNTILNLIVGSEDPLNNYYKGDGRAVEDNMKSNTGLLDKKV